MKTILRLAFFTLMAYVGNIANATPPLTVAVASTNVICNGANTGSINVSPGGGTGPYTYIWGNDSTTQNLNNIGAGTYSVTITDANGNQGFAMVAITEPAPFTFTKTITNEPCGGYDSGVVKISVTGSTPGYTFKWSNGDTSEDIANLTAQMYYVTVTDSNACTIVDSANVTQPEGVVISSSISNASCGMANGSIIITAQYGTPGYTYQWGDGPATQNRGAVNQGDYTITVTDSIGCTASATEVVGETPSGMSINYTTVEPTCFGGSNGSITISSVVGGTGPYTFIWNDSITTQNRTNIPANIYMVTATSNTGCSFTDTINLGQPVAMSVSLTQVPVTCPGSNNGAINTAVTHGTNPYTYNWGGGITTQDRTGLAAGAYTVTVTDFKGCTMAATDTVMQPAILVVNPVATGVSCAGGNTGAITTTATGGTAAYTYWWGAGVTSQNRNNLNAGTYTVTVTDAHGCTASASATVASYIPMTVFQVITNSICYGINSGSISANVSHGTGPFNYIWSNGDSTQLADSLAPGTYMVTITDNANCTVSKSFTTTQPAFPITLNSTITDISCNGDTDGSITINPTDGVSPYTYNWGGGITTQTISNLLPGTYNITVTDHNGCTATTSLPVTQPTPLAINLTGGNIACYGGSSGYIDLNATGSYPPYSFIWNDGSNKQNLTGLVAGNYTVTLTDNHGCTALATTTLTQSTNATLTTTVTNATCNGNSNGAVNLSVSGGTHPYTYNWTGNITTQNLTNIPAGGYSVTVTDSAGCTYTTSATITQPTAINIVATVTNIVCSSSNTGAINLGVSGGTSTYTFNWGGGVTSQNRSNLAGGNYTVTVTDHAGCTATNTSTVTQSTGLTVTATIINVTCNGANNGAINISSTGTSPNYNWGGGITSQNRSSLAPGNYTVSVTDVNGCTGVNTSSITQPNPLTIVASPVGTTCNGGNNGTISLSVNGGTPAYAYNWGNGITTPGRTNLSAGNYGVTVTDSAGCVASTLATVGQPALLSAASTITNISCDGGNSGSITLNVTGGTGADNYNWGGGITTQNRANLTAGNYTVTITDANGCTAANTSAVTQPTAITLTTTATNALCFGQASGGITSNTTGGASGYNYKWSNGITSANLSNVIAGPYTLTVTDANGCTAGSTANVGQATQINVALTPVNATCNGSATGSIDNTITGGTGAYTYVWSNTATTQNISNIDAGTYSVTVNDANHCSATGSANISQGAAINVNATVANVSCNGGNNGAITTAVNGGNGGYNYNWSNTATTSGISNLIAGNYTVTVKDISGCSAVKSVSVTQPVAITITKTIVNASCSGGNTGSITLGVTGGVAPYNFNWGGGITSQNRNSLAAGNYSVTVSDSNLCSAVATAVITQSTGITVTATAANASCFGQSNGSITLNTSGGSGNYTYSWSDSSTSQNLNNIPAGNYAVTVTDANLCSATATATVSQPSQIISTGFVTNAACNGSANGDVVLTVNGSAGGFIYKWSNNSTGQNLQAVSAGNYSVTVTDANLCTVTNSFTVTQPGAIVITTSENNINCFGGNNGSITTNVSGGAGNYTYSWNNTANTPGIGNLLAGAYTVTVKDAANCSTTATANITQPASLSASATTVNVSCNGGNNGEAALNVSGGTIPYNYQWSNNGTTQQLHNLTANTYTVTITDAKLCTTSASAAITQPAAIVLTENHSDYACAAQGGSITLTTTGGIGPYTYMWSSGANLSHLNNLNAGTYSVTITDANGCTVSRNILINQLPPMSDTLIKKDVTCYNTNNGSIITTVTGGTLPYRFLWSNNAITADLSKLYAGVYDVQITDSNSCIITASATINQPDQIVVTPDITPVSCNGASTGAININVTGGIPAYTYTWSNQSTAPDISNIASGTYSVTVADNQNCSAVVSGIVVTQAPQITVSATATAIGCNISQGSIALNVSGGSAPYWFNWSNLANTQNISGLTAGVYDVTVTDSKSCTANAIATVASSNPIIIASSVQNASCTGVDNGSIDLTVSGGTPSFNYLWNNGENSADILNMAPGNYSVTVTDAGGCSAVSDFVVATEYTLTVNATGSTTVKEGQSVSVNAVTNVDHNNVYSWSPPEYLTCSTCAATQAAPPQTTDFTVAVADDNGCTATGNITINVNTQVNLFIPNAFSPNGDGSNDYFQIFGDFSAIVYLDMAVFDRWGEKVYESQEPQFKWDGVYKGQPAPMGVYVYVMTVSFEDGSHQDFKGSVTLLR